MPQHDLEARLVDALDPSDATRAGVEKCVAKLADELDDDRLFADVVAAAEGETFGTRAFLARVPGLSARRLRHWTDLGLLEATEPRPGSGNSLRFAPSQVAIARQMMPLVLAGVTPTTARRVAGGVLEHGSAELAGLTVSS